MLLVPPLLPGLEGTTLRSAVQLPVLEAPRLAALPGLRQDVLLAPRKGGGMGIVRRQPRIRPRGGPLRQRGIADAWRADGGRRPLETRRRSPAAVAIVRRWLVLDGGRWKGVQAEEEEKGRERVQNHCVDTAVKASSECTIHNYANGKNSRHAVRQSSNRTGEKEKGHSTARRTTPWCASMSSIATTRAQLHCPKGSNSYMVAKASKVDH